MRLLMAAIVTVMCTAANGEEGKYPLFDPDVVRELVAQADRIVVVEEWPSPRELYSSSDPRDIAAFGEALKVKRPKSWYHCMCEGDPAIRLYKQTRLLVTITNHHGVSVRASLWDSNAPITDVEKWLTWFDARGITGPRREVEGARRGQAKPAR